MTKRPQFTCSMCGLHFMGYGNNPWPVIKNEEARCCDDCNQMVIAVRIAKRLRQPEGA